MPSLAEFVPLAAHVARAKARWRWLRGPALAEYQERRAQAIVTSAVERSPFYREHWAGHDPRDWRTLPEVNKRLMMKRFDAFNTADIGRGEALAVALEAERSRDFAPTVRGVTVGLSSGTSGHRGIFLASRAEQTAWAGILLARTLHRLRGRLRVAFFLRSNSNLYERVGGAVIQFRYFDLMQPPDQAMAALNLLRPHIVVAPPSLLGMLASARIQGRLHIAPERLISVAEVLEPQDERCISEAFDAPVHQIYQCTEGLLAVSCAHGSLHLQEDLVAVQCEPLRSISPDRLSSRGDGEMAAGSPSPHSEKWREEDATRVTPIVTDLWRRTQPIIRYRLNDVLRLASAPCACGSDWRVISAIEGRCDDVCYFLTDRGARRAFFPDTLRRAVLLATPDITEYQIVQERDGMVRVAVEVEPAARRDAVVAALRASFEDMTVRYACQQPEIAIEFGVEPVALGVKRRRVRRLRE